MKKKLHLPNVTLLSAASSSELLATSPSDEVDMTQLALKISLKEIEFGSVKLLSSEPPKEKYSNIEYISIPPMNNISDYSRFIIEDLHKYFKTTHCLIIQSDSWVVDSNNWKNKFLEFDYIGAPWTSKIQISPKLVLNLKKNIVGNGGFSLRSQKLVETTSKLNFDSLKFPYKNEDVIICHYLYNEMVNSGINFAPPKIAAQFSMEDEKTNNSFGYYANSVFGFHGKHLRNYFLNKYVLREKSGEWY